MAEVEEKKHHSPIEDGAVLDRKSSISEATPENTETVGFLTLFRYSSTWERLMILLGVLCGIVSGLCVPVNIVLYGEYTTLLVERSTPNNSVSSTDLLPWFGGGRQSNGSAEDTKTAIKEDAAAFGLGSTAVTCLQLVVSFISIASLNYTALTQTARVRRLFLQAVLRQDMAWYDTHSANNFASKVTDNLDKMQEGIGEKIGVFLYLSVSCLSCVVVAFLNGWKLTLVMLSCAPVIIICNWVVSRVQTALTAEEMQSYGKAGSVAEEVISSVKTVMAFCGETKEEQRYTAEVNASERSSLRRGLLSGLGGGVKWLIIYCFYALAFWYGVSLILESREDGNFEYTPAVLIIVLFGVLTGAMNLGHSTPHLEAFSIARGAAASIFAILERKSGIDPLSAEGKIPGSVAGHVTFSNVRFRYPARPGVEVLSGLSLTVKPGEMVALVGTSGCGKSTVMQLLQRLYDPEDGSVQLDGQDLRGLNVAWLRRQLGVVGQEPVLFAATIAENIRHGLEGATMQEVQAAAKLANAHDFIMQLPKGYETMLGQRGTQISGGQKQRVAIARALISNPRVLLLDEATSALDAANERKVQLALDSAAKGRTTLVATHRLSTIRNADRIFVISEGRVVEQGSYAKLVCLGAHFHELLKAQTDGKSDLPPTLARSEHDGEVVRSSHLDDRRCSASSVSSIGLVRGVPGREMTVQEAADGEEKGGDTLAPSSMARILKYNQPEWLYILVGCVSTLIVGGSVPAVAVLFGEAYGVLSRTNPDDVSSGTAMYSGLLVALGAITGLAAFLQMHTFNYAGVKLTSRVRTLAFAAILRQEAAWFDEERNRVGVLCARLSGDASGLQGATGSRLGVVLQSFSTILIGVVLGMVYSWKMTLVTLVGFPLVCSGIYFESVIIARQSIFEKEAIEGATNVAVEAISNIRTVASLGREQTFLDRYDRELQAGETGMKLKARVRGAVFSLGHAVPFFSYALSLWYGGVLVADEGMPYKNVIKVSEALIYGAWMLGQSLAFAPNFGQAKLSAARIFQLLDRQPQQQAEGRVHKDGSWRAEGTISLSKVEFAYPTRPEVQVLRGLTLDIGQGRNIGLVGPSGCGKSTVIQLLQRLYDPSCGEIRLDSEDVTELGLHQLRGQMGIVSQEPVLFDRTISENIAYGDNTRTVPEAEVIAAARAANIHDFITSLPQGYGTRLGTGGTQLSGGQKQRVAIARALIRNPRVLLLDEATSALDAASEAVVQTALDSAAQGRTTITVGHRLGAVARADVLYVLDQGGVCETGSHHELLTMGGTYARMLLQTDDT